MVVDIYDFMELLQVLLGLIRQNIFAEEELILKF
jgi:hypothetical protein